MNVWLIIPAYNEERRIGLMLKEYSEFFENVREGGQIEYHFLIVINNSFDRTEEIVKRWQKKNRRIKYLLLKKGGKGYAVKKGFEELIDEKVDFVGFVDADLATSPKEFYRLILEIGSNDGAIASRGLKDSQVKSTFKRKITNRGFNFVVRSILGVPFRDTQCGAKLFTKKTVEEIVKEEIDTQWAFDIDMLYRLWKRGRRIREIRTVWVDREGSAIKLITPVKMFSSVVRLRLLNSPFKFVVKAYDLLPERIKIHSL